MLDRLVKIFTSLKLTVVLLALGLILVFWGTLAQVHLGLYKAQNEFFRSFFVFWQPAGAGWKLPIFPGGYLVGGLLLINLFAAHFRYYRPDKRKIGIAIIHIGIVLLLLGQLLTDLLSVESSMHIRNGGSKNYSEAGRSFELAVIDTTDADSDKVVAIRGRRLAKGGDIAHAEMPFTVRVKRYLPNAELSRTNQAGLGFELVDAKHGAGGQIYWRPLPHETEMDKRDIPSGIIELTTPGGSLGTYFVSAYLDPQAFTHNGRNFTIELRAERFYKPFTLHLIEFRHDRYPGTEIPKDFSSLVRLERADTGEKREVRIYMNNPLRYDGETYYQASFDKDDQGTVLQVVRNPGWLTPYFACVLVSLGLTVQFLQHLVGFASKRKAA